MYSAATRHYFDKAQNFGHYIPDYPECATVKKYSAQVGQPDCGHYFYLELLVAEKDGQVRETSFTCPRCLPAIACGGLLDDLVAFKDIRTNEITVEYLIDLLDGLPPQRAFYAWMAVEAFRQIQQQFNTEFTTRQQ